MSGRSSPPAKVAPLSLLDLVCHAADDPGRPLDFAFLCHLPQGLPLAALRTGAESAMNQFPVSGSRIAGGRWVWAGATGPDLVRQDAANLRDPGACLDQPIDPRRAPPIVQIVRLDRNGGGQTLITRFHHAACDGLAAQLWLAHQLQVASGERTPVVQRQTAEPLRLRQHPSPNRRNRLSPAGPSRPLATHPGQPGATRRWVTTSAPAWPGSVGGVAESEALAASFLGALVERDDGRGESPASSPLGLWMPVNVRREPGRGFGNGTSRIRLHAHFDAATPLAQTCAILRRQQAAALRDGEWAVPERLFLSRLPGIGRGLIRLYARRPGVDMGSAVFTHLATTPLDGPSLPVIDGIEGIQVLDRRHPIGLSCVTLRGTTFCTFTYDPALLSRDEVVQIGALTCDRLDQLRREPRRRAA